MNATELANKIWGDESALKKAAEIIYNDPTEYDQISLRELEMMISDQLSDDELDELESLAEAKDYSNNYRSRRQHSRLGKYGDNYFPDGAHTTAKDASKIGNTGAEQGDNPISEKRTKDLSEVVKETMKHSKHHSTKKQLNEMNIGSEFDQRIGGDVAAAESFLSQYEAGDIIDYEEMDDVNFSDPGWHAIRNQLREVPGIGYEKLTEATTAGDIASTAQPLGARSVARTYDTASDRSQSGMRGSSGVNFPNDDTQQVYNWIMSDDRQFLQALDANINDLQDMVDRNLSRTDMLAGVDPSRVEWKRVYSAINESIERANGNKKLSEMDNSSRPRRMKRNALYPDERQKECPHEHLSYSGTMPNTGVKKCTMCGMEFDPETEEPYLDQESDEL